MPSGPMTVRSWEWDEEVNSIILTFTMDKQAYVVRFQPVSGPTPISEKDTPRNVIRETRGRARMISPLPGEKQSSEVNLPDLKPRPDDPPLDAIEVVSSE